MFSARTAIYFLVGTRGALMLLLRSSLVLAAFAALFQSQPGKEGAAAQRVVVVILKALGCFVLATAANLAKKVAIKLLATHHHREAHFGRMQEALRKEYFLSVLSQPRCAPHSAAGSFDSRCTAAASLGPSRSKSFAKRWLSRQALRKSMAALHTLPSLAARSFSGRSASCASGAKGAGRQRSLSDSLLAEESQLSDAPVPAVSPAGKSERSTTAALTSISIVVGAGVQPSSQSMPNLGASKAGQAGKAAQAVQAAQAANAPGKAGFAGRLTGYTIAHAAAAAAGAECPRPLPEAARCAAHAGPAAVCAAAPAAQQAGQRLSLASRHLSVLSGGTTQRSISFKAPSLLSLQSARTPPPLVALLDLEAPPPAARPQQRRTSIARASPEELEKMRHIEKHIRRNQLKVGLVDRLGNMKRCGQTAEAEEQEARRAAYFLYNNLRASRRRSWIQQSDLEDFLPPGQAREAFLYLDADGNGRISLQEIRASVLQIFQERSFLASPCATQVGVLQAGAPAGRAAADALRLCIPVHLWGQRVPGLADFLEHRLGFHLHLRQLDPHRV
ncbi:hypothetical protein ABPG77_004447 [Micractinium sp. CCAP 211/92]